ncbi:hypothetical protein AGMMS49953_00940 [Endomicrobiia bacterium]|nr:hypothetical protein AGMMS49953_00940 [Endomicrobiia bacterium]
MSEERESASGFRARLAYFHVRIYVKVRSDFVFYIYLIDIYHLAWTDKENDETTLYNKHKTKKICLSNLNEIKQQPQK